MVLEKNK